MKIPCNASSGKLPVQKRSPSAVRCHKYRSAIPFYPGGQASIGHRQPSARNLAADVLQKEQEAAPNNGTSSRLRTHHPCEPLHTQNAGKNLDAHNETHELQAIGGAHGERFYWTSRSAIAAAAPRRKLERTDRPRGLRPVLGKNRIPDKAGEMALVGPYHLMKHI